MQSLQLILSNFRYFAPAWVFTSINILMGTWALYIPHVKEKLALNDSEIGFALFSYALGILFFLPIVPYLTKKIGVGQYTIIGIILFAFAFLFLLLAPNYLLLCSCLFVIGIFSGSTDIAMNALVSEIEKQDACNFMSAAHGFFSLGGVIGGSLGSIFLTFYIDPLLHITIISLFVIITNLLIAKHYRHIKEEKQLTEKSSYPLKKLRPLIGLAFLAFVIMSSEGAIEHWSNLYFLEVVQITADNLAGIGFIAFSVMMTIGRFFGDGISKRFGSMQIIIYGCLVAMIGYLFILYQSLLITTMGFGILGLGLSVIIPELFRMAGKVKGVTASVSISFVSGIGFVGFLIGPVLLGFISSYSSLSNSFLFLFLLVVLALIISIFQINKKFIE